MSVDSSLFVENVILVGIATWFARSNARKVILPGVGYMANLEGPDGFDEAVLSFRSKRWRVVSPLGRAVVRVESERYG